MKIMVRTDSSAQMGSGHVMRCLCLARAWRARNHEVAFWCRAWPGDMRAHIVQQGFPVHTIASLRDGGDFAREDAACCVQEVGKGVELVVVDHYGLDAQWEETMQCAGAYVMALDDLALRKHTCHILLDQNVLPGMERCYDGQVKSSCTLLLGPRYALLGEAFRQQVVPLRRQASVRRLLLFFGGGDADNVTARVMREIMELGIYADVVIGVSNPHRDSIASLCDNWGAAHCRLHVQTDRMADLMSMSDLMLSAGGSTHWERCRMGLPGVVASVATNQVAVSVALAACGVCEYLGDIEAVADGAWREAVQRFVDGHGRLVAMQSAAFALVPDGLGCERVLDTVEEVMGYAHD
jgi:UDP-2,4-diacetamido-2,4,6-trideoxy-beta-L-altropyranose hydrolase